MRIAAQVARDKELHPERFCPAHRCLWRTGDGSRCPRHQTREVVEVTNEMRPLRELEVRQALKRRERANEEYLEALEEFLAAGGSYADLARLLGVSRQAVRQMVERGRPSQSRGGGGRCDSSDTSE
jgi:DNA-directed RNA polymerase specialized sigma24 family protein